MARIPRLTMAGEPAVYHVISRTALDGFVLGDVEKEYLLTLIQRLSTVYFIEVLGFCLMGNHFHLLVRMHSETSFSDDEIRKRF
jgi:REP element-mobilizing transposase RayT